MFGCGQSSKITIIVAAKLAKNPDLEVKYMSVIYKPEVRVKNISL